MKLSRRNFHTTVLSAAAMAQAAGQNAPAPGQKLALPDGPSVAAGGEGFDFPLPPSPRLRWKVTGLPRKYFTEWLPALFERTLAIEEWKTPQSQLRWMFTGPMGGFTVEAGAGKVRVLQRYDDSPALAKSSPVRDLRHPEAVVEETSVEYSGQLQSIAVTLDHRLSLRVTLNGQEALAQHCHLDINRHQLAMAGEQGGFRGRLLPAAVETATVIVDPTTRFQQMMGWGGTTTPPAFAELSEEGSRAWWHKLVEYNLLLHREYPIGTRLNPEMTNWDRAQDASPHYYGDNFPNCETSDFAYNRRVRQLGGKVIFEFWEFPVWARQHDSQGKITDVPKMAEYARAMVRYCQVSRDRTGAPPEIVGIQNEIRQPPEIWQEMGVTLRRALDDAGLRDVKIHMHNAPTLSEGIAAARAFHAKEAVWTTIDYATSNVYDYQGYFYDPDGFDARVREMKEVIGSKPFLASELCVNSAAFQTRTYRTALAMGQLYHKLLTLLDAAQRRPAVLRLDPHPDGAGSRTRVHARGLQPSVTCFRRLLSPGAGRHDARGERQFEPEPVRDGLHRRRRPTDADRVKPIHRSPEDFPHLARGGVPLPGDRQPATGERRPAGARREGQCLGSDRRTRRHRDPDRRGTRPCPRRFFQSLKAAATCHGPGHGYKRLTVSVWSRHQAARESTTPDRPSRRHLAHRGVGWTSPDQVGILPRREGPDNLLVRVTSKIWTVPAHSSVLLFLAAQLEMTVSPFATAAIDK
jgi:hypothetical protein